MVLGKNSKLRNCIVSIEKEQDFYLRSKGINRSKFFRQAVEAYQAGKFDYMFIEAEELEEVDIPEED